MSTLNITERPILFSGPMVRAILEGRKTVTRRIAKPVKHPDLGNIYTPGALVLESEPQHVIDRACPYGQPGERLWVRETWSIDMLGAHSTVNGYDSLYALRYRADDAEREIHVAPGEPDPYLKLYDNRRGDWRPSIHMPRWACRILLEITAVRIERLQDISEEQAIAEGVHRDHRRWFATDDGGPAYQCPIAAFSQLWRDTGGNWNANPWVWVVEFKRVSQ